MLRSMKDMEHYEIGASDGRIGHVKDLYFDDHQWVVRYLVVDASTWLSSHKVLISPIAIREAAWRAGMLTVSITREQVRNAPDIDTEKPVSRQHEVQYAGYYGYPYYWGGMGLWGSGNYPGLMATDWGFGDEELQGAETREGRISTRGLTDLRGDPHLRSCRAVTGYHVHATDGDVGHVLEVLFDDETWAVRYLVVETGNWWVGHRVLIAPQWVKNVEWIDGSVFVDLTRAAVKGSPPFLSTAELNREQEQGLYEHYDRAGYWLGVTSRESASSVD